MSKLEFNIVEIPEGESKRHEILKPEDVDLSPYKFTGAAIDLKFNRQRHFIRLNYTIHAAVELTCDRSLKKFQYPVNTDYDIVFKTDVEQETEDENGAVRRFNFPDNTLSIEKEVRDSILLMIPIQKIHPDYRDEDGNYPDFGTQTFGKTSADDEKTIDPRWKKLKELTTKD